MILSLSQLQSISNGLPLANRSGERVRVRLDRFIVPSPEFEDGSRPENQTIEDAEFISELFYDPDEAKFYLAWVSKTITPAL